MFNIGSGELVLIAVVALLILGPKRLPELARGLGKFLREFRRQTDEVRGVVEREFYKMDHEMDAAPPPVLKPANDPVPTATGTGGVEDAPMDHSDPRHPDYGKPDPHVLPEEPVPPVEPQAVTQHHDPTPPQPAEPTPAVPGAEPPPASEPEKKAS